ncbi:MAG: hypothetical protein ACI8WB_005136 [Phenylobacterium sp.]|jgi:hypothetical protein
MAQINTSGVIDVPGQGQQYPFDVVANQVTAVELPTSLMSPIPYFDVVVDNGIHVSSVDDITLYALNFYPSSTDGFLVLPTDALIEVRSGGDIIGKTQRLVEEIALLAIVGTTIWQIEMGHISFLIK